MPIILRMQGLDAKAGAEVIRGFFKCLLIPKGGVYIVGGQLKEAFIAFSKDRDAQLAMRQSGHNLKSSLVTLYISSMKELEWRLMLLLKKKKKNTNQLTTKESQPHPPADMENGTPHDDHVTQRPIGASQLGELDDLDPPLAHSNSQSLDSSTAFNLGICTVLLGIQTSHTTVPNIEFSQGDVKDGFSAVKRKPEISSKPGYVRLFGLPTSTTKEDICSFFKGLAVEEVLTNVKLGFKVGCLVKFAQKQDALDALRFNQHQLRSCCVEVRTADEKLWADALRECENAFDLEPLQYFSGEHLNSHFLNKKSTDLCSFEKPKSDSGSRNALSSPKEYIVMVNNLPNNITKTELKYLFSCPNIPHKNVLHLLKQNGKTTDTAFFIFDRLEDFEYAINLSGCHVGSGTIKVSSITTKLMKEIMAETNPENKRCLKEMRNCHKRKL